VKSSDENIGKAFKVLYTDYNMFLGPEAIGFYFNLHWLHMRSLGKPITLEYIKNKTLLPEEQISFLLKKLAVFKLVSRTKITRDGESDWEWMVHTPKYISTENKYAYVEKMYNKVLIDGVEKDRLFQYIKDTAHYIEQEHDTEDSTTVKDKDFTTGVRQIDPDSAMALVIYYYQTLGEVFGGRYVSRNIEMETARLKDCMRNNNDTPEQTREFMRWGIEKAKSKNQFEKVASLGLYPEFRKHAYHALYVKQNGDKKFEEKVDDMDKGDKLSKNIRDVYNIYINDGLNHEQALIRLKENFNDEEVINKALEGVNV